MGSNTIQHFRQTTVCVCFHFLINWSREFIVNKDETFKLRNLSVGKHSQEFVIRSILISSGQGVQGLKQSCVTFQACAALEITGMVLEKPSSFFQFLIHMHSELFNM